MRLIVTGTGRCGTGHMSRLLSAYGIPTGHEAIFHPNTPPFTSEGLQCDSSWMAAPFLEHYKGVAVIVHIVRRPYDVIRSLKEIGFFDPKVDHGAYREYAKRYFMPHKHEDPETAFYRRWNDMIKPWADLTYRIEEVNEDTIYQIAYAMGLPEPSVVHDDLLPDSQYNSRHDEDFTIPMTGEIAMLHKEYGYEI